MKIANIGILCGTLSLPLAIPAVFEHAICPQAAVVPANPVEVSTGVIQSVDRNNNTFVLAEQDVEITLEVDENTVFLLDGVEASKDDVLQRDHRAVVTHRGELATRVAARSEPD